MKARFQTSQVKSLCVVSGCLLGLIVLAMVQAGSSGVLAMSAARATHLNITGNSIRVNSGEIGDAGAVWRRPYPAPTNATASHSLHRGELSSSDATFMHPEDGSIGGSCAVSSDSVYYDRFTYTHAGGSLIIYLWGQDANAGTLDDPFLALYQQPFDPGNPCNNIVEGDDDDGGELNARLYFASLPAGNYDIVATSYDDLGEGTYTLFYADGDVRAQGDLSASDLTFTPPRDGSTASACTEAVEAAYYDTFAYTHGGGSLVAFMWGVDSNGGTLDDPFLALYQAPFNPNYPCDNIVEADDDDGTGLLDARLQFASLPAGNYVVVATSYDELGEGTYTVTWGPEGDLDGNGCVAVDDLGIAGAVWRRTIDLPLDLDDDDWGTIIDVETAASHMGEGCP